MGNYCAPVYFNANVYYCAVDDSIKAFQLSGGLLSSEPTSTSPEVYGFPEAPYQFLLAAMRMESSGDTAKWDYVSEVLYAYDASNLANELYNSKQAVTAISLTMQRSLTPLCCQWKVYVATMSTLTVYGSLPRQFPLNVICCSLSIL